MWDVVFACESGYIRHSKKGGHCPVELVEDSDGAGRVMHRDRLNLVGEGEPVQKGSDLQVAPGDGKAENLIIPLWKCTTQGPVLAPSCTCPLQGGGPSTFSEAGSHIRGTTSACLCSVITESHFIPGDQAARTQGAVFPPLCKHDKSLIFD